MGICSSTPNIKQFKKLETNPPPVFSFANIKQWGYVLRVVDGDTIRILMVYRKDIIQLNCRLAGIDCAEMKSKDNHEVLLAEAAKEYLTTLIDKKLVWIEFSPKQNEKYKRDLIWIYLKENKNKSQPSDIYQSINYKLVHEGYAHEYNGRGKKLPWIKGFPPSKTTVITIK